MVNTFCLYFAEQRKNCGISNIARRRAMKEEPRIVKECSYSLSQGVRRLIVTDLVASFDIGRRKKMKTDVR